MQTLAWGSYVSDWGRMIRAIADLGFEGVEFAQHPQNLPRPKQLATYLQENKLQFIGMTGGSLQERVEFCRDGVTAAYLYVEIWNDAAAEILNSGQPLALHPHFFMPIRRIGDALEKLKMHENLGLILDLAHIFLAGDTLEKVWDHVGDRVVAVHLKDWTQEFGRSSHGYARGVVEFGNGDVHPERAVEFLTKVKFSGWLVAEQDWSRRHPIQTLVKQAEWLVDRGLLKRTEFGRQEPTPGPLEITLNTEVQSATELQFLREMFTAGHELLGPCYERVVLACARLFPGSHVTVWSYSAPQDMMILQASNPEMVAGERTTIPSCRQHLWGKALERKAVTRQTITNRPTDELTALVSASTLNSANGNLTIISIPILNPYNLNHVRLIVNVVQATEADGAGAQGVAAAEGDLGGRTLTPSDADLMRLSMYIGWATNSALDDWCSYASAKGSFAAARATQSNPLMNELVHDIQHVCDCEAVSILVVNHAGDQLELRASTGQFRWLSEDKFYRTGEGITGMVWRNNEALLVSDFREHPSYASKSEEVVKTAARREMMYVPLVNSQGEVQGVIRCRNRRHQTSPTASTMFSDDDAAVVDALAHSAAPYLEALRRLERRTRALQHQSHEMKNPLVWTLGSVDLIRQSLADRHTSAKSYFGQDYLADIDSYCDMALGLLANSQSATSNEPIKLKPKRIFLLAQVVAPAVRQVGPLCKQSGFSVDNIVCNSESFLKHIPPLHVDLPKFQQIFFNLLTNAIKYAYQDPSQFGVEILASENATSYIFKVQDYGPGIDPGLREKIFLEGFRALPPGAQPTEGHGWGLWIARQMVERHYGTIELSNCLRPTEFTIRVPKWLASRLPT